MPDDLTREEIEVRVGKIRANVRSSQSSRNWASAALQAPADMAWLLGVADLALRQMDEIERLLGEYRKVYDWGEVLDKDCNTLSADLAAAERARDRAQCRLAEVATVLQGDKGSGAESPDPRWSFALEQAREKMADLAAARAALAPKEDGDG